MGGVGSQSDRYFYIVERDRWSALPSRPANLESWTPQQRTTELAIGCCEPLPASQSITTT